MRCISCISDISKFELFCRVTHAAILHTLTEQLPTTAIWTLLTKSTSSSFYPLFSKNAISSFTMRLPSVFVLQLGSTKPLSFFYIFCLKNHFVSKIIPPLIVARYTQKHNTLGNKVLGGVQVLPFST